MYEVQFLRFGEDVPAPTVLQAKELARDNLDDAKSKARLLYVTTQPATVNGYRIVAHGAVVYQWREDY